MENIYKELKCSICLEFFTCPKLLQPCQHIFCQQCLQKHVDVQQRNVEGKVDYQCPLCRRKASLPPGGVSELPDPEDPLIADLSKRLRHLEDHDANVATIIKNAAKKKRAKVQARITEGRSILESYWSCIQRLRQEEKTLSEQKQQTEKGIDQAYENKLKVTQGGQETMKTTQDLSIIEKVQILKNRNELFMAVGQNHKANLEIIKKEKDKMLSNVSELFAACDQAEQEMEWGDDKILALGTTLTTVVRKYRGRVPQFPPIRHVVFQPAHSPGKLGKLRITVHNFPTAPIPATPASTSGAARGTGHHQQGVTLGEEGDELGQFDNPSGIAVSDQGVIFVADSGNQRIQVFDQLKGTFVRQFPTDMPGGQKMKPEDMALDRNRNLWVVGNKESDGHGVAVQYNKYGRVLTHFGLPRSCHFRGVAVDTRSNNILVTLKEGNNPCGEVQVFGPDGTVGTAAREGMNFPTYITVDGEGRILVTDENSHYVYVFSGNGEFLFQFGGEGSGEGQLKNPLGICTDRAGNIIVADWVNRRVEMFNKSGEFLKHITTNMEGPQAVAMGAQGQLVVADSAENEVTLFQNL